MESSRPVTIFQFLIFLKIPIPFVPNSHSICPKSFFSFVSNFHSIFLNPHSIVPNSHSICPKFSFHLSQILIPFSQISIIFPQISIPFSQISIIFSQIFFHLHPSYIFLCIYHSPHFSYKSFYFVIIHIKLRNSRISSGQYGVSFLFYTFIFIL